VYAVIYLIIKQIRKNSAECWVLSAELWKPYGLDYNNIE
jgi:hypothetical protein